MRPRQMPIALVPEPGALADGAQYGRIEPGMACEPGYHRILDRVRADGFAVFPGLAD